MYFFTMQKQFDCVKIQDVWRNARGYIFGFAIYYIDFCIANGRFPLLH